MTSGFLKKIQENLEHIQLDRKNPQYNLRNIKNNPLLLQFLGESVVDDAIVYLSRS